MVNLLKMLLRVYIKVQNPISMQTGNAAESAPSPIEDGSELRQLLRQMQQETRQMQQETIEAVRLELQSVPTTGVQSGCCTIQ
jgi:uncharacterized membrane protein